MNNCVPRDLVTHAAPRIDPVLRSLPLVTLYLTERCNSRCVTCDYWRNGRLDMTMESVERLVPSLEALRTRVVLISGGEPLLNPEWTAIAAMLKSHGLRLWLLTSGLSLTKHSANVAEHFESVTVSLDGTGRETYSAIRGLDAFDTVCAGIRAIAQQGIPATVRVTVQRANYRELPDFVKLARTLHASSVSFLAADVSNPHAFSRNLQDGFAGDVALDSDDLPELERILNTMERDLANDFRTGFIAESPAKLRRILAYYTAIIGHGAFPPVRCNAPEFSAVIEADGSVRPCFFIPGGGALVRGDLKRALNDSEMVGLRSDIREQRRTECERCVCSMWRDLHTADGAWDQPS